MCITKGERAAIFRDSIIIGIFIICLIVIGIAINLGVRSDVDCDLPKKCSFLYLGGKEYELYIQNESYCIVELLKKPENNTLCYPRILEDNYCSIEFKCYNVGYIWLRAGLDIVFIIFPGILIVYCIFHLIRRYRSLSETFSTEEDGH